MGKGAGRQAWWSEFHSHDEKRELTHLSRLLPSTQARRRAHAQHVNNTIALVKGSISSGFRDQHSVKMLPSSECLAGVCHLKTAGQTPSSLDSHSRDAQASYKIRFLEIVWCLTKPVIFLLSFIPSSIGAHEISNVILALRMRE